MITITQYIVVCPNCPNVIISTREPNWICAKCKIPMTLVFERVINTDGLEILEQIEK